MFGAVISSRLGRVSGGVRREKEGNKKIAGARPRNKKYTTQRASEGKFNAAIVAARAQRECRYIKSENQIVKAEYLSVNLRVYRVTRA